MNLLTTDPSLDGENFAHNSSGNPGDRERLLELERANAKLRLDNAARMATIQALRRAELRYRDIFDNATEGIIQWTPGGRLLTANASFARMLGFSNVNSLLSYYADSSFVFGSDPIAREELNDQLEKTGRVVNFELQIQQRDGRMVWTSLNARQVLGIDGSASYYEGFIENITSRKQNEEKLVHQAFHDPLTGLANRALFNDRLRMALNRVQRRSDYSFSLLYMDLNLFKSINDTYGHNTGDDVLRYVADCILGNVRKTETVARLGGDEFAIIIEDAPGPEMILHVAQRICERLDKPFKIQSFDLKIGVSIGIVLRGELYTQPEVILSDADVAMYQAKSRGPQSHYAIYTDDMYKSVDKNLSLEHDLRQALRNNEIFLEYQPMLEIETGQVYGFEALARWKRGDDMVCPTIFIPLAEEHGLIKQLGLYLFQDVCRFVHNWEQKEGRPFMVHLNLSSKQLDEPCFYYDVLEILRETEANPKLLRFEVAEQALASASGNSLNAMRKIRDLGIRFCLDDYGHGFSSLGYLRTIPLDCLKLDRSFVNKLETDNFARAILRCMVQLGEDLEITVVAEGVENEKQLDILKAANCTYAQGFWFNPALTIENALSLLDDKPAKG